VTIDRPQDRAASMRPLRRGTTVTWTPRRSCRNHGIRLAGKSPSTTTIRSPGRQDSPSATLSRPCEVLVVRATSPGEAPSSRAAAARACSRRSSQPAKPSDPWRRASSTKPVNASATGRASGAQAAWLK